MTETTSWCEVASDRRTSVDVGELLAFAATTTQLAAQLTRSAQSTASSLAMTSPTSLTPGSRTRAWSALRAALAASGRLEELSVRVRIAAVAYEQVEERIAETSRSVSVPTLLPAIGALSGLYPSYPTVREGPFDLGERSAPAAVDELLALVIGEGGAPAGRVDVWSLPGGDTYVVALPGTSSWDLPGGDTPEDIRDLHADLQAISRRRTAELEALPDAVAAAGVPEGAQVIVVGHSLGGMTAVAAAGDAAFTERFEVAFVVTAGSPLATLPEITAPLLSVENQADPVPAADLTPPRGGAAHTTVSYLDAGPQPHDLGRYALAAGALGSCADPAVRTRLAELHALLRPERRPLFVSSGSSGPPASPVSSVSSVSSVSPVVPTPPAPARGRRVVLRRVVPAPATR